MNLLILSSHSILEYDDLRLFSDLGYDVFIPGAYADPSNPGEMGSRPALPNAPHHPELNALCNEQREKHGDVGLDMGIVDWAKADLHPKLIDWADVIMVNCFPDTWIGYQWDRIRDKRVIWRTIGQSNPHLEHEMRQFEGLEIVRYSPAEKRAFEPLGVFAGEDALIRFCKYPSDFLPWTGDWTVYSNDKGPVVGATGQGTPYVTNITQNLDTRGEHCGLDFWLEATKGLPTVPAGLGSERMGGLGWLSYDQMIKFLAGTRAYLYMGTQPASYTLGLMEAMLAGVPVVSIGPGDMWMPALFEGHELTVGGLLWRGTDGFEGVGSGYVNGPDGARDFLTAYLNDPSLAGLAGSIQRQKAIDLFGPDTIGPQWLDFLGHPTSASWQDAQAVPV